MISVRGGREFLGTTSSQIKYKSQEKGAKKRTKLTKLQGQRGGGSQYLKISSDKNHCQEIYVTHTAWNWFLGTGLTHNNIYVRQGSYVVVMQTFSLMKSFHFSPNLTNRDEVCISNRV